MSGRKAGRPSVIGGETVTLVCGDASFVVARGAACPAVVGWHAARAANCTGWLSRYAHSSDSAAGGGAALLEAQFCLFQQRGELFPVGLAGWLFAARVSAPFLILVLFCPSEQKKKSSAAPRHAADPGHSAAGAASRKLHDVTPLSVLSPPQSEDGRGGSLE